VIRRRSLHGLLVVRTMLITNGALLALIGALYAVFGGRPSGYIIGAVLGAAAVALWALVPLTDPYRSDRHTARW
jgi:drug/metabolite transporter (DMT)-like permease